MSFSQIIDLCINGRSVTETWPEDFGGIKSQPPPRTQKERCAEALRNFDSAIAESRRIQQGVSESSKLLEKSSTDVITCMACQKNALRGDDK